MPVQSLAPPEQQRIALLWHEALGSEQRASSRPAAEVLRQRLTDDLAHCQITVVRNGAEIVAFVMCDPDQRWLRQLFVHPDFQGQGIGTWLLATAMRAMPAGWLRTDETNERARRFYLRRGLKVRGKGPHPRSGAPTVEFEWP